MTYLLNYLFCNHFYFLSDFRFSGFLLTNSLLIRENNNGILLTMVFLQFRFHFVVPENPVFSVLREFTTRFCLYYSSVHVQSDYFREQGRTQRVNYCT